MQKFIIKIDSEKDSVIQDDSIECYLISSKLNKAAIQCFAATAAKKDKIVLAEDAETCHEFGLDGVLADFSKSENIKKDFAELKSSLDKDKFVGIISRNRRHEAMLISEEEPDFVAFRAWAEGVDNVKELVAWYNEFFLIQSAVILEEEGLNAKDFDVDMAIMPMSTYKILLAKK